MLHEEVAIDWSLLQRQINNLKLLEEVEMDFMTQVKKIIINLRKKKFFF